MITNFKGNVEKLTTYYHTYHIQNDKEILFIGYAKLSDIMSFRQVAALESFEPLEEYTVVIHEAFSNRLEAVNNLQGLINQMCGGILPPFNREIGINKGKRVKCNETGVIYGNAHQACQALKIHPPRMCKHLQGCKGHKTIHGLSFKYI